MGITYLLRFPLIRGLQEAIWSLWGLQGLEMVSMTLQSLLLSYVNVIVDVNERWHSHAMFVLGEITVSNEGKRRPGGLWSSWKLFLTNVGVFNIVLSGI